MKKIKSFYLNNKRDGILIKVVRFYQCWDLEKLSFEIF